MSAQLTDSGTPIVSPLTKVFDRHGHLAKSYREPEFTIDPENFYGSVTKGYAADGRTKLRALLSFSAIAVRFAKVTEGRPYSIALRLRELGYEGELHAVGAVNKEIVYHLVRVGFSHIHLADRLDSIPREIFSPFSFAYQAVNSKEALNLAGDL